MDYKSILLEIENGIAKITMRRPDQMNAVNIEMASELVEVTESLGRNKEVRVVVLTGDDRAFCAGGDLNSSIYDIKNPIELERVILMVGQISLNIRNMSKPVIAMINGAAVGAGFSFSLACDMRICSDKAKLGHVYMNLGVQSDAGGIHFLPRLVGTAKACELVFTGNIIDAHEAERIGLVNKVVPADELESETMKLASHLATRASFALSVAKKSIYQGLNMDLATAVEFEARAQTLTMLSDDMTEGIAAFKEKRSPKFD